MHPPEGAPQEAFRGRELPRGAFRGVRTFRSGKAVVSSSLARAGVQEGSPAAPAVRARLEFGQQERSDPGAGTPGRRGPGSPCPSGNTALKDSTSKAQSSDARSSSASTTSHRLWAAASGLSSDSVLQGGRGAGFLSWDRIQSSWGRSAPHLLQPEDIGQRMRSMWRLSA